MKLFAGCKATGIAILTMVSSWSTACACLAPDNLEVQMGDQRNVIVWDDGSKTEHFFRTAKFETEGSDFSFIAPTPSIPNFGEGDSAVFDELDNLEKFVQSEIAKNTPKNSDSAGAAMDSSVQVVQSTRAAGYKIQTLKASDSAALVAWLKENDYMLSPDTKSWFDFYVKKRWYFSAFKFDNSATRVASPLLRMSFKTEKPFAPYFIPASNFYKGWFPRLQVYFISDKPYGANGQFGQISPQWSVLMSTTSRRIIAKNLGDKSFTPNFGSNKILTLTSGSFSEGAKDDLYFEPMDMPIYGARDEALKQYLWIGAVIFGGAYFYMRSRRPKEDGHVMVG